MSTKCIFVIFAAVFLGSILTLLFIQDLPAPVPSSPMQECISRQSEVIEYQGKVLQDAVQTCKDLSKECERLTRQVQELQQTDNLVEVFQTAKELSQIQNTEAEHLREELRKAWFHFTQLMHRQGITEVVLPPVPAAKDTPPGTVTFNNVPEGIKITVSPGK